MRRRSPKRNSRRRSRSRKPSSRRSVSPKNKYEKEKMKKKASRKRAAMRARLKRELDLERRRLANLKVDYPELFRICDKKTGTPCCQAATEDGSPCQRAALTTKSYFKRTRCCFLCWQHAMMYGVYGILSVGKAVYENQMTWDEYCFLEPEKCQAYFDP